jgi:hypothetical protein
MSEPRSGLVRFLIAFVLFALFFSPYVVFDFVAEDRDRWPVWVAPVVLSGLLWFVTPLVSYRRRDALCGLIPFYNIWFVARIAWRLAYLPHRDWDPRPDERPR